MARLEIHPFSADHLDESAVLLARRHARHRHAEPFLPASYEQPEVNRVAIEALATAGHGSAGDPRSFGFIAPSPDGSVGVAAMVG